MDSGNDLFVQVKANQPTLLNKLAVLAGKAPPSGTAYDAALLHASPRRRGRPVETVKSRTEPTHAEQAQRRTLSTKVNRARPGVVVLIGGTVRSA